MKDKSPFHYGWIIVGFSFTTLGLVHSVWYSFSVFFVSLIREFNWSRAVSAGAFSLFLIISSVIGPFVGGMVDRLGPRRVIVIGSLILGIGVALCSLIHLWWHFYIFFGIIVAMGVGGSGWVSNITIVQQWFKDNRGLATGIVSSGIGIGILFYVPLIQYLILQFGWRAAYRIMALAIPLVIISLAMAILRKPSITIPSHPGEKEIPEVHTKGPLAVNAEWMSQSWTLERAITTKPFWLLGVSIFLGSFVTQSTFAHQVAFFVVDSGLDPLFASYIVGLVGVVSIVGKILLGGLSDRIGREITYTIGISCAIIGLLILTLLSLHPFRLLPYFYPFFFAMGYSVIAALPPLITADLFGVQAFGGIFGSLMVFMGSGGAFGAWFAGFVYDLAGTYLPLFIILIACALFSSINIWLAAPRKIRTVPGRITRK